MKILNISSSSGIGGREMLVMTLSNALKKAGHNVRLLTAPHTWLSQQKFSGYTLPMKKYIDLYSIYNIGKILKEFQPEIVHIYFISDIWLVVPAVKLFSPKTKIFLLRSMQSSPMKDFTRTKLFAGLNKIITMSDFITEDFLSKTNVLPEKVQTIYIGVDPQDFEGPAKQNQPNILKQKYNLDKETLLVGLVGRIDKAKGQDKFIEAIKQICEQTTKNVKFFIVGSAEKGAGEDYVNTLKARATKLHIYDKVIFTGFRSDIPDIMNALDIAVFPSKNEAFGLVVIEAMAASRAVIGFNRGAFPEIILDQKTGITTDYEHSALSKGILELIEDDKKRKKFAKAGRKRVIEKFTLDETITKFIELYTS
ncbi:MAG: glycosyltransferase family 4 protein [bacterium]|nr:glycosyltransferase family 4 protein [bacterium]